MSTALSDLAERLVSGGHHQVAAQQKVGLAGGNAHSLDVVLIAADPHMADHRAKLLCQAGLVHGGAALAFNVRRHRHQRGDGQHAGATNACHHGIPRFVQIGQHRLRQRIEQGIHIAGSAIGFAQLAADHGHKAGAKTVGAAVVLVAGALVDLALAPQFGLLGNDRQTVGLDTAVTASFTHCIVDEQALGGIFQSAFFAPAALLRGAGLHKNDDRSTVVFAQLALQGIHLVAVVQAVAGDAAELAAPGLRMIADQSDPVDALRRHLLDQVGDRQGAVKRLAPGHRHRIVVEDFVGNAHPGGNRGANRQQPGVEVGAVTQVLEYVFGGGKWRLANPGRTLATHLGEGVGLAVRHPGGHVVAADPAKGVTAFRHLGGGVVGAAGTEMRHPLDGLARLGQGDFLLLDPANATFHGLGLVEAPDAAGNRQRYHGRGQLGEIGQQVTTVFVELAKHARARCHRVVVELTGKLVLDDGALLLHHQDFLQPLGKIVGGARLQRPGHAHLVDAQANLRGHGVVDAHVLQRLHHVQIGLAGGDDAKARIGAIHDDAVEAVHPGKLPRRIDLVFVEPQFLLQRLVWPAPVHPIERQLKLLGNHDLNAVGINVRGDRGIHVLGDGLQRHPATAVARQLPAEDTQIQHFLHVAGAQHRHRGADKHVLGLVRQGG